MEIEEIEERLEKALPDIARRLQNELTLAAPVDRARLKPSIKVRATNYGVIIWMVEEGEYVEFGTPPHIIRAKEGGVLHWHDKKGRTQHKHPHSKEMAKDAHYAKKVKHPGTRPNPFIRNTLQLKLPQIIIEELLR